ncbi:hypothetical protein KA005_64765, partial [bacterium]|nr:hypothetical protein [bacterium]
EHALTIGDPSGVHVLAEGVGGGREKVTKKWEKFWKRTLGIGSPDAPAIPNDPNIFTDEEIKARAKESREGELLRRMGTRGRSTTIKTGSRGIGDGLQTTSKQLGGR